jgi:SulP family sulfate permease
MLRPKLFDTLKTYNSQQFGKDAIAGLIVGIVAIPLAIEIAMHPEFLQKKGYTQL